VSAARAAVRTVGELLLTTGLVLLLYVAYTLVWTNVQADTEARRVVDDLQSRWAAPAPVSTVPGQPGRLAAAPPVVEPPPSGDAFALLYIPRLGDDWVVPVLQGVGSRVLSTGIGHYPKTAMPGQVGNFAVAGHRATHGEPFANLDRMRPGDAVGVQTRTGWYVYRVERTEIVPPTRVSVILPVPNRPGATPTQRRMTLTTCHPRWGSTERLIVYTRLESSTPSAAGRPPALAT
jgi:sortase A